MGFGANAREVLIFPNPTSTNLNVRYNLAKEDDITIALFDMQAKINSIKNEKGKLKKQLCVT